jgi:hypothetical protein
MGRRASWAGREPAVAGSRGRAPPHSTCLGHPAPRACQSPAAAGARTAPPRRRRRPLSRRPQYIELLRKCRLRERARAARERMHGLFPLNEAQWLKWLGDEMGAARSPADLERIKGLYQRAVKDYLSIDLWAGYLE